LRPPPAFMGWSGWLGQFFAFFAHAVAGHFAASDLCFQDKRSNSLVP